MHMKIRWPLLLAAAASLAVGSLLLTERPVLTKEGEGMRIQTMRKEMKAALPPIDAEATKRTETATFALG